MYTAQLQGNVHPRCVQHVLQTDPTCVLDVSLSGKKLCGSHVSLAAEVLCLPY